MKILLVTGCFPPTNVIGAVRTGKMAKYLLRQGHKMKILTPDRRTSADSLPLEVPAEIVISTKWLDVDQTFRQILGKNFEQQVKKGKITKNDRRTSKKSILSHCLRVYTSFFHFPDNFIGWYPYAILAGQKLLQDWKPDMIYASAVPYTSLLIAKTLSRRFGIPWVAEFRDLWVDNHYREFGPIRNWLDKKLERRILKSVAGIITVSEPAAQILRSKYPRPCAVITNGFDPEDFHEGVKPANESFLRIVYTGSIYQGKRNPSNLLKALDLLGELKKWVKLDFFGPHLGLVKDLAKQHGCETNVMVHEPVPYSNSLRIQQEADVLLLLLWDSPQEKGVFTGKLFEYFGARRPILVIGPSDNVASETITKRQAGFVSNDPNQIAEHLKIWIDQKLKGIPISSPPENATNEFTREEQAKTLAEFLESILQSNRRTE